MRNSLLIMLFLLATVFSGCLSEDGPGDDDGTAQTADGDGDGFTDAQENAFGSDPDDAASVPTVPDALHFEGTLRGIGEGFVMGATTGCALKDSDAGLDEDPGCASHEVAVPAPGWTVSFLLSPGAGTVTTAADYDLFIHNEAGEEIALSTNPGGEDDKVSMRLAAGTYTAQVMAWDNQDAPYTLDVTFAF